VKPGDVIAEIETDKATMEYEPIDEGTLAKIVVPQGTPDVPVQTLIAVLAEEGEDVKATEAAAGKGATAKPVPQKPASATTTDTAERDAACPANVTGTPRACAAASVAASRAAACSTASAAGSLSSARRHSGRARQPRIFFSVGAAARQGSRH